MYIIAITSTNLLGGGHWGSPSGCVRVRVRVRVRARARAWVRVRGWAGVFVRSRFTLGFTVVTFVEVFVLLHAT